MLKEIIYPLGGQIDVRAVKVGDETLSVMEIWGAEYQVREVSGHRGSFAPGSLSSVSPTLSSLPPNSPLPFPLRRRTMPS